MTTLIIDHRNVSLDYDRDCVLIRQEDHPLRSVPLARLQCILCMHNVTTSTRLIGHCQRLGVDFIVINGRHSEHSFAVHAQQQQQANRRIAQYQLTISPEQASPLAHRLVRHKLALSLRTLHHGPESAAQDQALQSIRQQLKACRQCCDLDQLRGHEGSAQRVLFAHWQQRLPKSLGFTRRQRRPPPDPVNALLSLTFTLIYQEAIRQCLMHGLDPWLGIYHQPYAGRMSLACDLMEPLRPLVEAWVVECFCSGEFDLRHFSRHDGTCLLGKTGREHYYSLWHAQLPGWSKRLGRYAALLASHLDEKAERAHMT